MDAHGASTRRRERDYSHRIDDAEIRALVKRLSRRHPSGGDVVERAAILASGADGPAIMTWVAAHGNAEDLGAPTTPGGLHGARFGGGSDAARVPLRYVLPPGTLGDD